MCHRLITVTLIFIIFKEAVATKSLFIEQDAISSSLIRITCIVSDDKGVSGIRLHCPLLDADICYFDCNPECKYENENCLIPSELKSITLCEKKAEGSDYVRFQYTIDVENIKRINGEWYCSYEGITSRQIKLNVTKKIFENVTTKTSILKEIIPKTKATKNSETLNNKPNGDVVTKNIKISLDVPKISATPISLSGQPKEEKFDFRKFITNYEVVVGIIILLSLSVLLNFIFCIRDSLIKQFIDNIKSNVRSSKYLLCCVCQNDLDGISATEKLDRILSKDPDYVSTDASNCSKNDNFVNELYHPLMNPMFSTIDSTPNYNSNITRSASLITPDIPQNIQSTNYDQVYLTTPHRMSPYIKYPYILTRSQIGSNESYTDYVNQRHSYVFPPNINLQSLTTAYQNTPSKKHSSQNDIDLIRHCDSQDQPSKPLESVNK